MVTNLLGQCYPHALVPKVDEVTLEVLCDGESLIRTLSASLEKQSCVRGNRLVHYFPGPTTHSRILRLGFDGHRRHRSPLRVWCVCVCLIDAHLFDNQNSACRGGQKWRLIAQTHVLLCLMLRSFILLDFISTPSSSLSFPTHYRPLILYLHLPSIPYLPLLLPLNEVAPSLVGLAC